LGERNDIQPVVATSDSTSLTLSDIQKSREVKQKPIIAVVVIVVDILFVGIVNKLAENITSIELMFISVKFIDTQKLYEVAVLMLSLLLPDRVK